MNNENIIRLKLKKDRTFFAEVDVLMSNKFYLTVVNRLYYSCFHATTALLLTKALTSKTHKGVSKLLHEHFVHNGSFDGQKATFFGLLMKERMDDDYNDFLIIDEDEAKDFIEPSKQYIEYVSKLIDAYSMPKVPTVQVSPRRSRDKYDTTGMPCGKDSCGEKL